MRPQKFFLTPLIALAITYVNCLGQATLSNSIPNDGCRTTATGTLTVSTSTAIAWQEGEMFGSTFYPVFTYNVKSKTFNYSTSASETYYRAKVTSTSYSSVIRIRNFSPPVAGTLSGAATYLETGTGTLTLGGYSGNIVKWQSSDDGIFWTNITNTTDNQSYSNLTQTTHFRVWVGMSGCSDVISNAVTVTILPAGTVSNSIMSEGCRTSASGMLTAVNYSSVIRWEEGHMQGPNFIIDNIINSTSPSYSYTTSVFERSYRAKLATDIYSSVITVTNFTPPSGGTLAGATTFTDSGTGSLTLSGYSGQIIRWDFSTNSGATWNTITHTSDFYTYSNLTQTTHFRAILGNTFCAPVASNVAVVAIIPAPALTNSIANEGCRTSAAGALTVDYPTVDQWEEGEIVGSTFHPVYTYSTHLPTFNYSTTSAETHYRAKLGTNMYSTVIRIRNYYPPVGGQLSGSAVHEESGSGTLSLNGHSGQIVKWQHKTGSAGWTDLAHTSPSYSYTNLTESTSFRTILRTEGCPDTNSGSASAAILHKGTLAGPSAIYSDGVASMTMAEHNVPVLSWEYSLDGEATWVSEDCEADSFNFPITGTTSFRVKLDFAPLGTRYSNVHSVSLNSLTYSEGNPVTGVAGQNYVREQKVTIDGISIISEVETLTSSEKHEAFSYADGLGRTIQTVSVKGSPLEKDLVNFSIYDHHGLASKRYLPYVSTASTGAYKTTFIQDQESFYSNGESDKVEDTSFPFAETVFDRSPLFRVTEQGSTGEAWQVGNGHTVRSLSTVNTSTDQIRLFHYDGSSSGYYPPNELVIKEITDGDNRKRQAIADKFGRTVLTRVQLDDTIDATFEPWLETYYVYYPDGKVRYIISPKGVRALKDGSWSFTQSIKDQFVYQFIYDVHGRIVEKKTPGQAPVYYCYDRLDRLILIQDGNTRPQNKWFYIKYDRLGRPVIQGLYTNSTHVTRTAVQTNVIDLLFNSPLAKYYEERGTAQHGYTNQVFPTTDAEVLTVNYYDTHDFDFTGGNDFFYTPQSLANEGVPVANATGLLTGTKRIVIGTSIWLAEYYFYDIDGRLIQKRNNNHLSSAPDNLVTVVYDFEGKVRIQKTDHKTTSNTITESRTFLYDNTGRAKEIWHSINGSPDQLVAQYHYNELGQLTDKKLHNTGPSTFLQSIDYRYNIQGWIKSINNSQLTDDGLTNDETNDYFGMEMLYDKTETGISSSPLFSGNISGVKWKGPGAVAGAEDQHKYSFTYDKADRLTSALSAAHGGTGWTSESHALDERMTYDHNGNLLSLQRNDRKHQLDGLVATYVSGQIDDLSYVYNSSVGDQLLKVTDAAPSEAGFNNGSSGTSVDYVYDAQGNLKSDLNKGISSVVYNVLGKAKEINFVDGRRIDYVFDAAGNKLSMKIWQGSSLISTTDYVGSFVYEDNNLSFFGAPEGRVIKKGSNLEYEYAIADHQNNTRVIFTSATPDIATLGTDLETDNGQLENFPSGANHSSLSLFNNTPGGTYSQLLNGGNNGQVGVARSLAVYPGDKIKIEAYAKYEGSNASDPGSFATALLGAFSLSAPLPGETGTSAAALDYWGTLIDNGLQNDDPSAPQAFVNIIIFDKDYNFLDASWEQVSNTAEQVGVSPDVPHDYMMREYTIREAGFVFMYVSNNSPVNVYFDDVQITHTPTNIIQYNEYYPFGLRTSASWTREDAADNRYLYNAGSELNKTSGWYEMHYRGYDAAIGRMLQVDPYASYYSRHSPYAFAAANPVMINDPSGGILKAHTPDEMAALRDGWRLGEANRHVGGGGGRRGPGSGKHWSDSYGNAYRDYFLMSTLSFGEKYGRSASDYRERLYAMANDWGAPDGTNGYAGDGSGVFNKYGSWVIDGGTWVDRTAAAQLANRVEWQAGPGGPDPQTWYFMSRDPGSPHGLAYDPNTGTIYEVNHPSRGHGLLLWLEGILLNSVPNNGNTFSETKSVAYQWKRSNTDQWSEFWKREAGSTFLLSPVTVTNPAAATAWFQSQQGTSFDYNFFTNNCAHYTVQGLNAGGAGVNFIGPKPSSFPIAPTMTWSAGQPYPVPISK